MSKIDGKACNGALLVLYRINPLPKIIRLQYNPESLTRSFQAVKSNTGTGENDSSEIFRITNPGIETMSLDVEIDATENLEFPNKMSIKGQPNLKINAENIEIDATREMK